MNGQSCRFGPFGAVENKGITGSALCFMSGRLGAVGARLNYYSLQP